MFGRHRLSRVGVKARLISSGAMPRLIDTSRLEYQSSACGPTHGASTIARALPNVPFYVRVHQQPGTLGTCRGGSKAKH
eukprot:5881572-Pleurochrysis_carterae.AAC.1